MQEKSSEKYEILLISCVFLGYMCLNSNVVINFNGSSGYKLDQGGYYTVLNMNLLNFSEQNKKRKQESMDNNKAKFLLKLEKALSSQQCQGLTLSKEDTIIILIMVSSEEDVKNQVKAYGEIIKHIAKETFREGDFIIGVGGNYRGLEKVYKSAKEAQRAIEA